MKKVISEGFERAFGKLGTLEGGYSNDKDDGGGETYRGIARNFHGDWAGWRIIDGLKGKDDFPGVLNGEEKLESMVRDFYRKEYWDYLELGSYPEIVAEEVFECSVNCGMKKAIRIVQNTINILNRNGKLYRDIKVDGVYGGETKEFFKKCLGLNDVELVFSVLNVFQGAHYLELMILNPVYEKYIGWFKRVRTL